jgi:NRAMP (natural resistance-associated macrophage protein)-like metal ion transporter
VRTPILSSIRGWAGQLGPGLITGAADDDPSGIATYSQAGAQFGFGMLWSVMLTTPLMVGIQVVSARIGRVTGHGLAYNIRTHYPRPLVLMVVLLLLVANTLNIAADIGAMGEALQLVVGGPEHGHAVVFGVLAVLLQLFVPYSRLAPLLKWLTLGLFAYVAVLLTVHVPWGQVVLATFVPPVSFTRDYLMLLVGVLGTTISPYLFFWQASQEVEELRGNEGEEPLRQAPHQALEHLRRIRLDTWVGMAFSNGIAFCIMLTTAVTLNVAGVHDIETTRQAAQALRPLAGELAFALFALGVIGTGLLAIPVLAGSAAYAVAEAMEWRTGHALKPLEAKGFYSIIAAATLIGVAMDFTPIDPIRALLGAAVVNGVIAVPIMAVMMRLAVQPDVMGPFVITPRLRRLGWAATALMALAVGALIVSVL